MATASKADWAALFDWDGVVVDSSRLHALSWDLLAAAEGLTLPDGHFKKGFGRKNESIIPGILGWDLRRRGDPAPVAAQRGVLSPGRA
jgi:beta-phosphoglucomutase-like phosphatase (HAD superfamily)